MARINLAAGHDVIIPQIIQTHEFADSFEKLASECGANFYEFLLSVDKEEAIRRFILRGKADGNESGFRPGGIIDTGGREKKLAEMYDNMLNVVNERPNTITITPTMNDIEGTYKEMLNNLS